MKTWWTEKGWPWLKGNWWVLLLLPLVVLVAAGMFAMRFLGGPKTVVVDPTAAADERARVEADTRERELRAENERLEAELKKIQEEHASLREVFEQRLAEKVDELREDPEKLREFLLRAGRGG